MSDIIVLPFKGGDSLKEETLAYNRHFLRGGYKEHMKSILEGGHENPHGDLEKEQKYYNRNLNPSYSDLQAGNYERYGLDTEAKVNEHLNHLKSLVKPGYDLGSIPGLGHYKEDSEKYNLPLRKFTSFHPADIKAIHDMGKITSHKLEHNYIGFRGFGTEEHQNQFHIKDMKPGQEFIDKGFTGTSLRRGIGEFYANQLYNPKDPNYHHYYSKIYMPKGTMGHYLDVHPSEFSDENELLLHRGTKFKVLGHTQYESRHNSEFMPKHIYHVTHLLVTGNHAHEHPLTPHDEYNAKLNSEKSLDDKIPY